MFLLSFLIAWLSSEVSAAENPSATSTNGNPEAVATAQINQRAQELNLILRQEWEIINRLTKNRTVPVREGSREYFACCKADARINAAKAELAQLKEKLSKIEEEARNKAREAELAQRNKKSSDVEPMTNPSEDEKDISQAADQKLKTNPFGDAHVSDVKVDTTGRRIVGQLYEEVVKEYGIPNDVDREDNGVVRASWQKGVRLVTARFQPNRVCDALRIMDISGQLKYGARKDLFEKYKAGHEKSVKEFNKVDNNSSDSASMMQRHIMSTGMEAFTTRIVDISNLLNEDDQALAVFELYLNNDSKPFGELKMIFAGLRQAQNIDDL